MSKAKRWRPQNTKLTRQRIDALVEAVGLGLPLKEACVATHTGITSFFAWRKHARELLERRERGERIRTTRAERLMLELHQRLEESEGMFLKRCLARIQSVGANSWQAWAWLLERRRPQEFGRIAKQPEGPDSESNVTRDPGEIIREMIARTIGVDQNKVDQDKPVDTEGPK